MSSQPVRCVRAFVRASLASSLVLAFAPAHAAPPASSPYVTDAQHSYVEDATSEGIGQVNMITCIMAAMRPEMLVNKGAYNALVDESKCEPNGSNEGGADSAAGGDAAAAGKFMTAVVNATRASNNDPMISKIWIEMEEEGEKQLIDVHVAATAAATATNPYGTFELSYCGQGSGSGDCRFNGFIEGSDTGIRYFHRETRDDGNGIYTATTALKLNAATTASGSGRMQMASTQGQSSAFDFAYNSSLYLRDDGSSGQCFTRDASDPDTGMSVWRYGLYDTVTGARIDRNSGFPIDYTNGSQTWHGYLGYYGLQLPNDALVTLQNGSTVQKVEYGTGGQAPTITPYTVVKADGRLLKFTRRTRSLAQMDGVRFNSYVGNVSGFFAGAQPNTQYEMYWDDAAGTMKVTGRFECSPGNPCQTVKLQSEQAVSLSFWGNQQGINGYSQSLGGEIFVGLAGVTLPADSASVEVAYRVQDLVYPNDVPATLYCVRDCPTRASLDTFFAQGSQSQSPFTVSSANNFAPTTAQNVVVYHGDSTELLTDALGHDIAFTDGEALQSRPQFMHGLRSGRLFIDLPAAECNQGSGTYCDWKVNDQEVYYQWETGPESHSQFAAVKNSSGAYVTFDAPLQVNFQVPQGARYGEYAGQILTLQYSGVGDLYGIPGTCVSRYTNEEVACNGGQDVRYVPAFVIPYDEAAGRVTAGVTPYLVKWLDREIRFAPKAPSVCAAAQLTPPTGVDLPQASVLKNPHDPSSPVYIGVKPTVTTAPRVIHGEVKY